MSSCDVLFKRITRLCAEMVAAGGSGDIVSLQMTRICEKYGFTEAEFIVNPNGILATAIAPDGTDVTSVRSIDGVGQNFGRLNRFDEYCDTIIETLPSSEEINLEIEKIRSERFLSKTALYIASIFLGTGFASLFGCGLKDVFIAIAACILIVFFGSILKKHTSNLFFYNALICLAVESLILVSAKYFGLCTHPESVSLGVIMLLISGLSFNEGLWFLINNDITIGFYKLNISIVGAIGIVIGIATPLLLIDNVTIQGLSTPDSLLIQGLKSMLACGGFAVLCSTDKKYVPVIAFGAGISQLVFAFLSEYIPSLFICMAASTFLVTAYSAFLSAKLKLNPNITRTVGILPLVPGSQLFYFLYGLVSHNTDLASRECTKLIAICLGICFGLSLGRMLFSSKILNGTKR